MMCKLLIVDDEADFRFLLSAEFADLGWDIDEAVDGLQALEKLARERFDAVILDYRMPRLSGAEVCQKLREAGNDVPVVLVTAATGVEQIAVSAGATTFLGKPFSFDELCRIVSNVARPCQPAPS